MITNPRLRKRAAVALIAASLLAFPETGSAQSANKIVDRHKKAVGGKAARRVRNILMTGTVRTSAGAEGRFEYRAAAPDHLRIEVDAGDFKFIECYNGKSAWLLDTRGLRTLLGPEAARLRLDAILANSRLNDLSRHKIFADSLQTATVDGRPSHVLTFRKEGVTSKLYIDAATNLLVKRERESAEGLIEMFFSDYRGVNGVMEAFSIRMIRGTTSLQIAITSVDHNRLVAEADFRYPRVDGQRALPDVDALMKAIVANQEKTEALRERYTFRQTETENKLDGKGRIKETDTRIYEVTPVAGVFIRRLINVNGRDLTPSQLEKEDREVRKETEKAIKRQEKRKKDEEHAEADDEDGEITVLSFLKLTEITSVRRELFRGHEVIAFDFEPRKGVKPRGRLENLVSKLAGTMWVDEEAQQIVRVEARLTDSFKFAGGLLASLSPSSAVVLEQEKVGDEVWLPSYAEANISARVLLFARFNRWLTTRYSDYKRYRIDSDYELAKPKEGADLEKKP